jgi:hypothetical protein
MTMPRVSAIESIQAVELQFIASSCMRIFMNDQKTIGANAALHGS